MQEKFRNLQENLEKAQDIIDEGELERCRGDDDVEIFPCSIFPIYSHCLVLFQSSNVSCTQ